MEYELRVDFILRNIYKHKKTAIKKAEDLRKLYSRLNINYKSIIIIKVDNNKREIIYINNPLETNF